MIRGILIITLCLLAYSAEGKLVDSIPTLNGVYHKEFVDSVVDRVMESAPFYESIVQDFRANLYIKGKMDIRKKNFILRYVPSMFRLQKGVNEYLLETYSDLHYTAPNIYDQKVNVETVAYPVCWNI